PVCFSINEIQKNEHNALLSLSLMSISDKPIQFILLEMRPVDSRGQWILPSDTSATNVRTIRLSSELLSDEITVYSEVIDWDYEDLSNIEITYLKINYVDGSTYEQNDAHILNETLIIIKGDHS
ncbi:MAG TPA: hypothetical protein PKK43_07485, partial [Spirochaetota bacterium]|nr:hypothetical protein [Spirochaetota bacterium]